jgi:hypothetical protein
MYVWDVDAITRTVTVQRGHLGSTAAAATAGSIIEVAPRFPRWEIMCSMLDEIRSWPPSIFRVDYWSSTLASGLDAIQIPNTYTDATAVLGVFKSPRTGSQRWRRISSVNLQKSLPPGSSTLMVALGETTDTASTYQIAFARPFILDEWELTTDLIDEVGLTETLLDAMAYGVAARLMAAIEVDRTDQDGQGLPRLAEEVKEGSALQLAAAYLQLRDRRLADESVRRIREFPIRYGT